MPCCRSRLGRDSGVFRKSSRGGTTPKRAHLVTLRAPGRKGATDTQCVAARLQEKSKGVLSGILPVLPDFDRFLTRRRACPTLLLSTKFNGNLWQILRMPHAKTVAEAVKRGRLRAFCCSISALGLSTHHGHGVRGEHFSRREHGEIGHVGQQIDQGHQRQRDIEGPRQTSAAQRRHGDPLSHPPRRGSS